MSGVQIEVDTKVGRSEAELAKIEHALNNIDKSVNKTGESFKSMFKGIGTAIAGSLSVAYLQNISTEFTTLSNKIALVTGRTRELTKVQDQLYQLSEDTRSSLDATVSTFSGLGRSLQSAGKSSEQILKATKAIQQSVAISGGANASADAAIFQLNQGLSAGVLRGEELNSVMEQAPRLAQAIADELKMTSGQLRLIAADGKLTSEVVFKALLNQSEKINKEFGTMAPTLAQSTSLLNTGVKIYINELDKGLGLSDALGSTTFKIAKGIKEASKNAFDLGTKIAYTYHTAAASVSMIAKPILSTFGSIGKMLADAVPKGFLTRTLKGDTNEAIRQVDKMTGGIITSFKRFSFSSIFSFKSDVEKAISDLKKLSPKYWAASGFDVPTIKQFFSTENLTAYAGAFKNLAVAMASDADAMGGKITRAFKTIDFAFRSVQRYFGFKLDTIFAFRSGNVENFLVAMSEIVRGVSGVSIKLWNVSRLIQANLMPGLDVLRSAVLDAFSVLPGTIASTVKTASEIVIGFIHRVIQILYELTHSINIKGVFESAYDSVNNFYGSVLETAKLDSAFNAIKKFGDKVIHVFFTIYDEVIGHSWWTDTIDSVVSMSGSLMSRAGGYFTRFKTFVSDTFAGILGTVLKYTGRVLDNSEGFGKSVGESLLGGLINRNIGRDFKITTTALDTFVEYADNLFTAIATMAVASLSIAFRAVKEFGKNVIHVFFTIYDEVIGHSWWTDTVENVVDTSNNLWNKASRGLTKFKDNTIDIFKNVFDGSRRISFDFKDIKSIDLSFTKFKLPSIKTNGITDSIVQGLEKVKDFAKDLFESFPVIARAAFAGVAGIIVAAMFPAGAIKTALLTSIIASFATSSTLIAEQFGATLTGGSFVSSVGNAIGKAVGIGVSGFIDEIPKILNAISGFASSFVKGFASEMPVIGKMIQGVFGIADKFGVAGPLGLFSLYFFGKGASSLLKDLGGTSDLMESFNKTFDKFKKFITGNGDGFLSKAVFGKLGATRAVSGLAIFLDMLGAFDAIFASSPLAHMAAEGGFLYTAILGDKGLNGIKDMLGTKVLKPVMDSVKSALSAGKGNQASLYEVFFGDTGTWAERASVAIKSVIDKVTGKVVDAAAPYVAEGFEFVKTLLLGKDPEKTAANIKMVLLDVYDSALTQIGKIREMLQKSRIGELFTNMMPTAGASSSSGYQAMMDRVFKGVETQAKKMESIASKIGGENGLLGRLFLGKYGKQILVASILATFSAFALAQESAPKAPNSNEGPIDAIVRQWNSLKLENPFAATVIQVTAVSIPALLAALYVFRAKAIAVFSEVFALQKITEFASNASTAIIGVTKKMKNILLLGGAGAIGGFVGNAFGGTEMAMLGATMAFSLAEAFRKPLLGLLSRVFTATVGLLALKIVAAIAAIAAIGGALYIFFFGKKGEFWSEVGRAYDKIKEMIGLADKPKSIRFGISAESEKFLKSNNIGLSYDLTSINQNNLQKSDSEKLGKRIAELEEALKKAVDEQEATGQVSSNTRDSINDLNRGLVNYTERLAAKTAYDPKKFGETLQKLVNPSDTSYASTYTLDRQQSNLRVLYAINELGLQIRQKLAPDQQTKSNITDQLNKLRSEKGTTYNARYRAFTPEDKKTVELNKSVQELEFTNSKLMKETNDLSEAFLRVAAEIKDAKANNRVWYDPSTWAGRDLPANDPLMLKKNKIQNQLNQKMQEDINFDAQTRAINAFQDSLQNVATNFKTIGISLNTDELFVVDDKAFLKLRDLGEEAKNLGEQLKKTKDIAEHNAIVVRIEEIKTQTTILKAEADKNNLERKQFKLKELVEKVGGNAVSDAVYRALPDSAADTLFSRYIDIWNRMELLKKKNPISMDPVGTDADKEGKRPLLAKVRRNNALYLVESKKLAKEVKEADEDFVNLIKSGVGGSNALPQLNKDLANSAGVDYSKLITTRGYDAANSAVETLTSKLQQLNVATDPKEITRLNKEIETLRENIAQAPMDVQSMISALSSLGQSVSLEDLVNIKPEAFASLRKTSFVMRDIEVQMKRITGSISQSQLAGIVKKKFEAAKASFSAFLETIYSTPDKISQAFAGMGLSDAYQISLIPDSEYNALKDANKEILKLKQDLQDPANVSRFREIEGLLAAAQLRVDSIKANMASFSARSESADKAFNTGLNKQEFAALPVDVQIQISDQADELLRRIEKLQSIPISKETPERNAAVQKALQTSYEELRKASSEWNKKLQESGVRLQANLSNADSMPISELVSKITEVFPALADFKEKLEQMPRPTLVSMAKQAIVAEDTRRSGDIGANGQTIQSAADALQSAVNKAFESLDFAAPGMGLQARLKALKIDVNESTFNLMNSAQKAIVDGLTKKLETASLNLKNAKSDSERIAAQNIVDGLISDIQYEIEKYSESTRKKSEEAGKVFASSVGEGIKSAFGDLLRGKSTPKDFIKSVMDTFANSVIDTLTNALLDPFTGEKGILTQQFQKLGSMIFSQFFGASQKGAESVASAGIGGMFSSAWGGVKDFFGFGSKTSDTASQTLSLGADAGSFLDSFGNSGLGSTTDDVVSAINTSSDTQKGLFDTLGGVFSDGLTNVSSFLQAGFTALISAFNTGMFSGIGSMVTASFDWIGAALGLASAGAKIGGSTPATPATSEVLTAATGGYIRGPGTGISDSISAMLSNGEFVVNAKATKENLALLQHINNGTLKQFATGGLVSGIKSAAAGSLLMGATAVTMPVHAKVDQNDTSKSKPTTQQVFQINVTGDVSRQTRAEIQRMIPHIATNINSYNREKN